MAKYRITRTGDYFKTRIIEADDCEVFEGACTFSVKVPYEYTDYDDKQINSTRNSLVVSFAPGSWLTVEKEGYY